MVRRIVPFLLFVATLALTSSCNVMTSDGFVSGPNQNFLQSDGGTPIITLDYQPADGSSVDPLLISHYQLKFSQPGSIGTFTIPHYLSGDTIRNIGSGTWNITVTAYDASSDLYATGSTNTQISTSTDTISFSLTLVSPGGNGQPGGGEDPPPTSFEANHFVTRWQTNNPGVSQNNQIKLPFVSNGSYNVVVEWGDGTSDTITAWDDPATTHTYASAGAYTVTIYSATGDLTPFTGWSFGSNYMNTEAGKLLEVKNWGKMQFGETTHQFYMADNLQITAADTPDLNQTTSLESAFWGASNFTSAPAIKDWDISTITSLKSTFSHCGNFNSNINEWNTSNVTSMYYTFYGAFAFNQPLDNWDTSRVTNMGGVFAHANSFNQSLAKWDYRAVEKIEWFINDTNLSNEHYNAFLIRLAAMWSFTRKRVSFTASGLKATTPEAKAARASLESKGWRFTDATE